MEYALEEVDLGTGRRYIIINEWTPHIENARKLMERFVGLDKVYVDYGGKRTKKFRIVARPKVDQYEIVEEE